MYIYTYVIQFKACFFFKLDIEKIKYQPARAYITHSYTNGHTIINYAKRLIDPARIYTPSAKTGRQCCALKRRGLHEQKRS